MKLGEGENKSILVMCAICYKLTVICFSTGANGKSWRAQNIGILITACKWKYIRRRAQNFCLRQIINKLHFHCTVQLKKCMQILYRHASKAQSNVICQQFYQKNTTTTKTSVTENGLLSLLSILEQLHSIFIHIKKCWF